MSDKNETKKENEAKDLENPDNSLSEAEEVQKDTPPLIQDEEKLLEKKVNEEKSETTEEEKSETKEKESATLKTVGKEAEQTKEPPKISLWRRFMNRVSQVVDYLFFILYVLLGIRAILVLIASDDSAGFVKLIYGATDFFYQPFVGVIPNIDVYGGLTIAFPVLFAILIYMILHLMINRLLAFLGAY